ncbi:23S rRNA (pseudouridine(1915)-N(3))-methyltransferase RlmH [Carboxylicivirga caseinilyticus]|uniref:23S rRNA (pseudouridine(1915)-N(3))-methyltransferase RlmH n=1 Tax=Carboxylicivirga caseinilyticus TaxID=3417572 RepID=UPI003D34F1DC|nr:23S rRNA (pseudouridine(1915)-N(3))-methyltransferase RlmH [Marinilabiliaceae bacterium A049]
MKIELVMIGKTDEKYLIQGIEKYLQRLKHYISFKMTTIPDLKNTKNLSEDQQKKLEGDQILSQLQPGDQLILLDENGKEFNSVGFSDFIEKKMISGLKRLVFVIGGPYGFSDEVYKKANQKISMSQMTFSHQMVRLFFTEQVYRAMTILKNEPYHHQ